MLLNRLKRLGSRASAFSPLSSQLLKSQSELPRPRVFKSNASSVTTPPLAASSRTTRPSPKREDIILPLEPANNVSGKYVNLWSLGFQPHPFTPVAPNTDYIFQKIGINLHHQADHPIGIIKQAIYSYFDSRLPGKFSKLDDLYPVGESQSPCPSLKSFSSPPKVLLNPN